MCIDPLRRRALPHAARNVTQVEPHSVTARFVEVIGHQLMHCGPKF
jgi:hypothetical protein